MKIGFIGLGIMGEPMALNITKKHHDTVYVYDHKPARIQNLEAAGAVGCADEHEVAQNADLIFSMIAKTAQVEALYHKIMPELAAGKLCIDMSTIDPTASKALAEEVKATGADFADAPVVKSRPAAEAGTLGIYFGGSEALFETVRPILSYMGENVIRLGGNGAGLVMKICHNALVSQIQNGVNETATLAAANGIDILTFAQAISYGGAGNLYLDTKKTPIRNEDYTTAFSIENMAKDVHICLDLAKQSGVFMPGEENAARVYDKAMEQGLGGEDFCATIKVVREGNA